jgi:hypothetical protein
MQKSNGQGGENMKAVNACIIPAYLLCVCALAFAAQEANVLYYYASSNRAQHYTGDDFDADSATGLWWGNTATGKIYQFWSGGRSKGAWVHPDGKTVAANVNSKLLIMDNNGKNVKDYTPANWPPEDRFWCYTEDGIFWTKDGKLHRFQPVSSTSTTLPFSNLFLGNKLSMSANGKRGMVSNPGASKIIPNPYDLDHNTVFEFANDYSSVKAWRNAPPDKQMGRLMEGQGIWGHGQCMTALGTKNVINNWCCGGLGESPCRSDITTSGHRYLGIYDFVKNDLTYMRCTANVSRGDAMWIHFSPEMCVNHDEYVIIAVGSYYDDDRNFQYLMFNWADPQKSFEVPAPFKGNIGGSWWGPLPSNTEPVIALDKSAITFSGITQPQNVVVSNSGAGTLGAVTVSEDAAWLTTDIQNNGTNTITIANNVSGSGLADGEYKATATVSGGGASNTASYTVILVKGDNVLLSPQNLQASVTGDNDDNVKLTWTDNSADEEGFAVERKKESTSWEEIARTNANATSYNDSGLSAETFYYRVRAFTADRLSAYSNEASIAVAGAQYVKFTSPSPNETLKSGSAYIIKWEENRVTNIKLEYSTDEGLTYKAITQTGGVVKGATDWANYEWSVPDIEAKGAILRIAEYTDVVDAHVKINISKDASVSRGALKYTGRRICTDKMYAVYNLHGRMIMCVSGSELQNNEIIKSITKGLIILTDLNQQASPAMKAVLLKK